MAIKTIYMNTLQPHDIEHDSRGVKIDEGLKVAYNRSGDVIFGTIVKLKKNSFYQIGTRWYLDFLLEIQDELGNISKVKNPNSFIII